MDWSALTVETAHGPEGGSARIRVYVAMTWTGGPVHPSLPVGVTVMARVRVDVVVESGYEEHRNGKSR
jgi:hypothetical protein